MMNNSNNPLDESHRECDLAVLANGASPTGAALDVLRSARVLTSSLAMATPFLPP